MLLRVVEETFSEVNSRNQQSQQKEIKMTGNSKKYRGIFGVVEMKSKFIITAMLVMLVSAGTVSGTVSDDMDIQAEIKNIWTSDSMSPIVLFGQNITLGEVVQSDLDLDAFSDPLPIYDSRCLGPKNYDKTVVSRIREGENKVRIIVDITGGTGFNPGSEGYIKIINPEWKITRFLYNPIDWHGPVGMYITPHTYYSGDGTKIDAIGGAISWQGRGGCPACGCRESGVHMEFIVEKVGPVSTQTDNIIFNDDFESYNVGTYPDSPWLTNSAESNAYITDQKAYSSNNSLKIEKAYEARQDAIPLNPIDKIGYEVSIRPYGKIKSCLYNTTTGSQDACIIFDCGIYAGEKEILYHTNFNVWYKIRVEADFNTQLMDVYINGELKGKDISVSSDESLFPGEIRYDSLSLQSQQFYGTYYDDVKVFGLTVPATIDIKPGSDPNCFNNDGHGVIPVAILSDCIDGSIPEGGLDATHVDPETVQLEGMTVRVVGKSDKLQAHIEDVNDNGCDDLIVQIVDQDGAFEGGETEATLTGNLYEVYGGTVIEGTDTICIVP